MFGSFLTLHNKSVASLFVRCSVSAGANLIEGYSLRRWPLETYPFFLMPLSPSPGVQEAQATQKVIQSTLLLIIV